jgi:hypothetical protein
MLQNKIHIDPLSGHFLIADMTHDAAKVAIVNRLNFEKLGKGNVTIPLRNAGRVLHVGTLGGMRLFGQPGRQRKTRKSH